jgi:hypothetical protein
VHSKLKDKPGIVSEKPFAMVSPPKLASNIWHAKNIAKKALGAAMTVAQAVAAGNPAAAAVRIPDTIMRDSAGNLKIIDAKFPCGGAQATWGPGQFKAYEKIAGKGNVKSVEPDDVKAEECE